LAAIIKLFIQLETADFH